MNNEKREKNKGGWKGEGRGERGLEGVKDRPGRLAEGCKRLYTEDKEDRVRGLKSGEKRKMKSREKTE